MNSIDRIVNALLAQQWKIITETNDVRTRSGPILHFHANADRIVLKENFL